MGNDLDLSQQRGDLRLLQVLNLKDKEIKAENSSSSIITANYNLQWAAGNQIHLLF